MECQGYIKGHNCLTVPARLDRCLDITDALHGNAILVVSVDVLIFKFADFVEENTDLVSDVRDIFVGGFAPKGQLLLERSEQIEFSTRMIKTAIGRRKHIRPHPCAPWRRAPGFA